MRQEAQSNAVRTEGAYDGHVALSNTERVFLGS